MKKLLFIVFLFFFSSQIFSQGLKTIVDNNIVNQGSRGINATKLKNSFYSIIDSINSVNNKVNIAKINAEQSLELAENFVSGQVFKGVWNATSNIPTLSTIASTTGDYYIVSVGGRQSITGDSTVFSIGDRIFSNGTNWYRVPVGETNRIADWQAQSYTVGSQVSYGGRDYFANSSVTSSDVPSISSKWSERLDFFTRIENESNRLIRFSSLANQPALNFVKYPNVGGSFSYSSNIVSMSTSGAGFSNAISDISCNNIVIGATRSWLVIGSTTNGVIIVSVKNSAIGELRVVNNLGNVSSTISTVFPTSAINSGATRYKIDASGSSIVISYTTDNVNYVVWGSAAKSALGVPYLERKLGFLVGSTEGTITTNIFGYEAYGYAPYKLDGSTIDSTEVIDSKYVLLGSNVAKGIEKVNSNNFLSKINAREYKSLFLNVTQPALSVVSFPSSNTFSVASNVVTITPSTFFSVIATRDEAESVVINYPTSGWIVVGYSSVSNQYIVVKVSTNSTGDVRSINSGGGASGSLGVSFPTTPIPSGTRIRIDANGSNIIISYSTNSGLTYTVWGSVAKSALGIAYSQKKLGILCYTGDGQTVNTFHNYEMVGYKNTELVGSNIPTISDLTGSSILLAAPTASGIAKIDATSIINSNKYAGGVASLFGDSITEQGGSSYGNKLKSKLSLSTVNVNGFSGHTFGFGSGIAGTLADATKLNTIISQAPSIIVIFAGTNDFGKNVVIGAVTSSTITETCGGLNYIINTLQTGLPNARIVVCTPTPRYYSGSTQFQANSLGLYLSDYVTAIKNVCDRHSIPVLDTYSRFGVNAYNYTAFYSDGLHFLSAGYDRITDMQADFIKGL